MSDKPIEPPRLDESAIAEQAARWHAALPTAGAKELADLAAWLKMSPRHGHHFLYATAVDRLLTQIDPERNRFDPHAWVKEARERENVVPLHAGSTPEAAETNEAHAASVSMPRAPLRNRRAFIGMGIAAGLAALLASGWAFQHWGWKEWSTHTGEQRAVELADGSILHLNTGTRVRVRLSAQARDIRLVKGEALFKVHRDTQRPFRVYAPGGVIQAIGTQFNVYRRDGATRVSVLEGAVRISAEKTAVAAGTDEPASLIAGQEAELKPDGAVRRRPAVDMVDVVAWRQRRLVFHANALAELTAEFNRYNRTPKFRLEGTDGRTRHYTGTFDADDPESFATVLSQENVYAVERTAQEIVIRPRR